MEQPAEMRAEELRRGIVGLPDADFPVLAAVDLGAESCRVSLLHWENGLPAITLAHRFPNAPRMVSGCLRWDLAAIEAGLDEGLRRCAVLASDLDPEGIHAIAVDGWAVDYVRLGADGVALADPFCYRDERTIDAEQALHARIEPERLRELTGVQLMRINTLYQQVADRMAAADHPDAAAKWLNLPEYILHRWGGEPVAELTNATHTQMVDLATRGWSGEIFTAAGLALDGAARLVSPGTVVGKLRGALTELPALRNTLLIAPACHDTASAIAGIPAAGDDWAYISSGTWSLVGALVSQPVNGPVARKENYTNLAAAGGQICFHKNVNGMWLIRQCLETWAAQGRAWTIEGLVSAAERFALAKGRPHPDTLLDVDDPDLMLAGNMPGRINSQRIQWGLMPIEETPERAPEFASLIFHSLARRYSVVLDRVADLTGKRLKRIYIVGGGSQNAFLNCLTQQATGLEVVRGSIESSTIGNFAVQLAGLEARQKGRGPLDAAAIARWATRLSAAN